MNSNFLFKSIVLVASMSSIASAYLTPGNGGGGQQPNPPHYCENPYGPCDQHGNPLPGNGGGHRPRPPQQPPYEPGYPTYPTEPSYGYREVKQVYVGRSVRNERLPLRQLAGLGASYRGWEVVSVRAQTRPNSPSTTMAQLVSGGRIVAEQRNPGYQLFLAPGSRLILGVTANDLQLTISGSTIIDVLEIEVINTQGGNGGNGGYEPNPYPQSDRIDINIYRSTIGNDRVDLTSYIDMYQYRGMRIESVEIRARAEYNVAIAELMINSFRSGTVQFSGGYTQPQTIRLNQRPVLGQGADSIILNTRGNMTIESVVLHLSRY
jgi:hypothetical protein